MWRLGSLVDFQTQNKLGGRRVGHRGGLSKSDRMNFTFSVKSEIESSAGSSVSPWQILGRTGGTGMGLEG